MHMSKVNNKASSYNPAQVEKVKQPGNIPSGQWPKYTSLFLSLPTREISAQHDYLW